MRLRKALQRRARAATRAAPASAAASALPNGRGGRVSGISSSPANKASKRRDASAGSVLTASSGAEPPEATGSAALAGALSAPPELCGP